MIQEAKPEWNYKNQYLKYNVIEFQIYASKTLFIGWR